VTEDKHVGAVERFITREWVLCAVQGVCATMDDVQTKPPYIRGRACGAVLVQVRDGMNRTRGQKEMLDRGEVCGIFHYADLTPRNRESAKQYLAYTEVFDTLIDEGWRVVSAPGQEVHGNVRISTDSQAGSMGEILGARD